MARDNQEEMSMGMTDLVKIGAAQIAAGEGWTVRDESDRMHTRMHVDFPNGLTASVIRGPFTYGGPQGLFEVAVIRPNGLDSDTVQGHLSVEEVLEFIRETAAAPGPATPAKDPR